MLIFVSEPRRAPVKTKTPATIDNTEAVAGFRSTGGRILHIHPTALTRGVTVAFKFNKSRIEFATAVQHRSDDFTRKVGTQVAIQHFNNGQTVHLPTNAKTVADVIVALRYFVRDFAAAA